MDSHARRPLADVAAPHSARERRAGDAGPHSDHAPRPTTAANQGRTGGLIGPARGRRSALPVVKTFGVPSLNLKGLAEGIPRSAKVRLTSTGPYTKGGGLRLGERRLTTALGKGRRPRDAVDELYFDGDHPYPFLRAQRHIDGVASISQVLRSEERRVGKECRSRWSP